MFDKKTELFFSNVLSIVAYEKFGALAKARILPISVLPTLRQISSLLKGGNLLIVLLFDVKCCFKWCDSQLKPDSSIHFSFMRQSLCRAWSSCRSGLLVQLYTFSITVDDLCILAYVIFRLLKLRGMVNITTLIPILCIESMKPKK